MKNQISTNKMSWSDLISGNVYRNNFISLESVILS